MKRAKKYWIWIRIECIVANEGFFGQLALLAINRFIFKKKSGLFIDLQQLAKKAIRAPF
jgi:hypothetical protein